MRKVTALLHHGEPDESDYWATCFEMPSAIAQGEMRQELLDNLAIALRDRSALNRPTLLLKIRQPRRSN